MKVFYLLLVASGLAAATSYAQTGAVGIGTITPAASAALDITATNRGLLLPRLSTTEIASIASAQEGLLVYNKTTFNFWGYQRYDSLVAKHDTLNSSYPLTLSQPVVGQSFTVPVATLLTGIDLEIYNYSNFGAQQIKVDLFSGTGYGGAFIGADTVAVPVGTPASTLFHFEFPETAVVANSVYSVRVACLSCGQQPNHATIGMFASSNSTDPYPGGQRLNASGVPFSGPPIDLRFLAHGFVIGWQSLEHSAVVR